MKRIVIIVITLFVLTANAAAQTLILGGDHPDPTAVRDGEDYYMTCSSFEYLPGLTVYLSRDLYHWEAIGSALNKNIGSVWAPDICKFEGLYYIYFTTSDGHDNFHNYVITSKGPYDKWSEPIDLHIGGWIDPCHVYDEATGKRWLFLSGGHRIQLSKDGLSTVGKLEKVYHGWQIPKEWIVEGLALEGPKLKKIGDYYYWLSAEGGTAGPATTHMVVVARSKSIDGPWVNCPHNPLIHTYSSKEQWWSKGHASLIDTPDGKLYAIYHAYNKDRLNQGRQVLMEPVEITEDGWLRSGSGTDQLPLFRIGKEWKGSLGFDPAKFSVSDSILTMIASGDNPTGSSPLLFTAPDPDFEISARFDNHGNVESGLLFYYNDRYFAGFGCGKEDKVCWRRGEMRRKGKHGMGCTIWIKLRFEDNVLTGYLSRDGKVWESQQWGQEMSGYQHNLLGGFMSLLPGIYCYGNGSAIVSHFKYIKL